MHLSQMSDTSNGWSLTTSEAATGNLWVTPESVQTQCMYELNVKNLSVYNTV